MNIRIVTDSSSDIPWDFADKHKIKVVSLSVIYDDKSYKEDRNYDLDQHYQKYVDNKDFLPKTSQPAPKEYLQAYEDLVDEGAKDILNIHVSNKLSGTANSINIATKIFREQNKEVNVHVWDTRHASYAEVFFIKEAIKLIEEGLSCQTAEARLVSARRVVWVNCCFKRVSVSEKLKRIKIVEKRRIIHVTTPVKI